MYLRVLIACFCLFTTHAFAQESEEVETLVKGDFHNGFVFSFDEKLSTVDGSFANFAGVHTGWIINHSLLIAIAGYGTTDAPRGLDMGYGGLLVEYFFDPNKLFNYSVRTLIGGGGMENDGYQHDRHDRHDHRVDGFFVAEPEARVTLNVFKPVRIGLGLGYRFVGADSSGLGLSGPVFNISLKFGRF